MEFQTAHIAPVETNELDNQRELDLCTQFSELVDGNMRTSFDLLFDGVDLYGPDGRGLDQVTKNGLSSARALAKEVPQLSFGIRRSSHELNERNDLIKVAQGNAPNTMIVPSDFPEELWSAEEDIAGYNVKRKQTMLRVLVRQPNGVIRMHSQSLDGSNRKALEAIYERFNLIPEPGELLGQRIQVNLNTEQQASIVDELTKTYDKSMSEQFGGEWYAGRRPADIRNTYDFVCKQTDLIDACIRSQRNGEMSDQFMYSVAATMERRFKEDKLNITSLIPGLKNVNKMSILQELEKNGQLARRAGMSFSACGGTLNPDGFNEELGFLNTGYGDKDDNENCTFISKQCPECGAKNVKTRSTATHISGACGCSVRKSKK